MGTQIFNSQIKDSIALAVWPDQTDATKKLSLAWWIAYFNGSEATVRIPRGTHEVLYDMTIPENICLKFDKGARLKVSDTKTLTVNGSIEAGLWQIFDGNGTLTGTPKNDEIYVEWFGAISDYDTDAKTGTDSASAMNKASVIAKTSKTRLASGGGNFKVEDTVTINCNTDLSLMNLYADGEAVSPVIRCGDSTNEYGPTSLYINLPRVINNNKAANGWGTSGIGVELANMRKCIVDVNTITSFGIGLNIRGYGGRGNSYNTINLTELTANKINLQVGNISEDISEGWCTENTFVKGSFAHYGSDTTDWAGTRQIKITSGSNHLFIHPCIESGVVEYAVELWGNYITFIQPRCEAVGSKRWLIGDSSGYSIIGGYQIHDIQTTQVPNTTCYGHLLLSSRAIKYIPSSGTTITASNNIVKFANRGDPTQKIEIGSGVKVFYQKTYPNILLSGYRHGIFFGDGNTDIPGATTTHPGFYRASDGSLYCTVSLSPNSDDVCNLGRASMKWSSVYATNGTIQTSDERAKTEISSIPEEWLDAWGDVEYIRFKMSDAVQKKGTDNARWHIGLIAQRVKEAFEARGLDAMKIGLLCYDEWDDIYEDIEVIDSEAVMDEEGNIITPEVKHTETVHSQTAGNLYSIRYDEALAMEAAYMRREVERLKSSINT